tara:strand:+ start:581 stop:865 length:285 start_codon:yes stop_codon:yes gene_type:complete
MNHRLISIELSLLALEHHEFEAYVEEINEILNCIESNYSYEDAPELSSEDLGMILESMCQRYSPNQSFSIKDFIYEQSDFGILRKKIRAILLNI